MRCTKFLMDYFPKGFHYLFEPVLSVHDIIKRNYSDKGIEFDLQGIALSDEPGKLYLHQRSINKSLSVTHSNLSTESKSEDPNVVIDEIEVSTLDRFFANIPLEKHKYVVKIDVDGLEEKIVRGGQNVIKDASFVIIEAPMRHVFRRGGLVESLGFELFDIVDPAYYRNQLWQVDLVMINKEIRQQEKKFRPRDFTGGRINLEEWHRYRG